MHSYSVAGAHATFESVEGSPSGQHRDRRRASARERGSRARDISLVQRVSSNGSHLSSNVASTLTPTSDAAAGIRCCPSTAARALARDGDGEAAEQSARRAAWQICTLRSLNTRM